MSSLTANKEVRSVISWRAYIRAKVIERGKNEEQVLPGARKTTKPSRVRSDSASITKCDSKMSTLTG